MDVFSQSFIVIIAVAVVLYMQIQRLTKSIDEKQAVEQNSTKKATSDTGISAKYGEFCEAINSELRELKNIALYDDGLKDEELKDKFLENLSDLSKKLAFIETMNSNKSSEKWESELFALLNKLNDLVERNLKDGEKIADEIKNRLEARYKGL
jgi:thioester dehydrase family protein